MNIRQLLFILITCFVCLKAAPQQYNQQTAINVVYYAAAAYCQDTDIASWKCGLACQYHPNMIDVSVFYNKSHHAQGYVGYDTSINTIVAAFRGTVDNTNVIYDLDIIKVQYSECQDCLVHQGFLKIYMDLQQDIVNAVKNLKQKYISAYLLVTGHSMGAAISTFGALDIQKYVGHVDMLQNFGCPRIGNYQFAQYVDNQLQTYYRQIHYKDPFPHLPFKDMGFWHPAYEVWYYDEDNTEYRVCSGSGEDKSCSDSIKTWKDSDHWTYLNVTIQCPQSKIETLN